MVHGGGPGGPEGHCASHPLIVVRLLLSLRLFLALFSAMFEVVLEGGSGMWAVECSRCVCASVDVLKYQIAQRSEWQEGWRQVPSMGGMQFSGTLGWLSLICYHLYLQIEPRPNPDKTRFPNYLSPLPRLADWLLTHLDSPPGIAAGTEARRGLSIGRSITPNRPSPWARRTRNWSRTPSIGWQQTHTVSAYSLTPIPMFSHKSLPGALAPLPWTLPRMICEPVAGLRSPSPESLFGSSKRGQSELHPYIRAKSFCTFPGNAPFS